MSETGKKAYDLAMNLAVALEEMRKEKGEAEGTADCKTLIRMVVAIALPDHGMQFVPDAPIRDWSKINPMDIIVADAADQRCQLAECRAAMEKASAKFDPYNNQSKMQERHECEFYNILAQFYLSRALPPLRWCHQNASRIIMTKYPDFKVPGYRKVCRWASHEYRIARQFMKEQAQ